MALQGPVAWIRFGPTCSSPLRTVSPPSQPLPSARFLFNLATAELNPRSPSSPPLAFEVLLQSTPLSKPPPAVFTLNRPKTSSSFLRAFFSHFHSFQDTQQQQLWHSRRRCCHLFFLSDPRSAWPVQHSVDFTTLWQTTSSIAALGFPSLLSQVFSARLDVIWIQTSRPPPPVVLPDGCS